MCAATAWLWPPSLRGSETSSRVKATTRHRYRFPIFPPEALVKQNDDTLCSIHLEDRISSAEVRPLAKTPRQIGNGRSRYELVRMRVLRIRDIGGMILVKELIALSRISLFEPYRTFPHSGLMGTWCASFLRTNAADRVLGDPGQREATPRYAAEQISRVSARL